MDIRPMRLDRCDIVGPASDDHDEADRSQIVDYTRDVAAGFAKRYLSTYFQSIDADERAISEFLVREYPKIKGTAAMLDLGCGPGIQHVLPAAPYVERIDMADYLPDNLAELRKWLTGEPQSHCWNHVTRLLLELERNPADPAAVAAREEQLRRKLGMIWQANVLQEQPLGYGQQYPAVGFFYCAEAAARTKEQWRKIMANVSRIVEPGGYLFMASLRNADHYMVDQADGHRERIPTACVNESDFQETLPACGFERQETTIDVASTPDMADHGIQEILLVSAKKRS